MSSQTQQAAAQQSATYYRPIYYADDDEDEEYPIDELEALETEAAGATPLDQGSALVHVAAALDANSIPYGTMGGFNFWNRGSGRRTGDVDIAVNRTPCMASMLNLFNNDPLITRPIKSMQLITGVARIFVSINGQPVQIDLKRQGVEDQGIPSDLNATVDHLEVASVPNSSVRFLKIRYLVHAKLRAFMNRDVVADYQDLLFVCTDDIWAPQVRDVAHFFNESWRIDFLEIVIQRNSLMEDRVRWAFRLEWTD